MKILKFTEYINEELSPSMRDKVDIVYRDTNLVILVPKTYEVSKKYSLKTRWCSNDIGMFLKHNERDNLYRLLFKNGKKIRLTWSYVDEIGYGAGCHWGTGWDPEKTGIERGSYSWIHPLDNNEPFEFDIDQMKSKGFSDERIKLAKDITELPQEAKEAIIEYQKKDLSNKVGKIKESIDFLNSIQLKSITVQNTPSNTDVKKMKDLQKQKEEEYRKQYPGYDTNVFFDSYQIQVPDVSEGYKAQIYADGKFFNIIINININWGRIIDVDLGDKFKNYIESKGLRSTYINRYLINDLEYVFKHVVNSKTIKSIIKGFNNRPKMDYPKFIELN